MSLVPQAPCLLLGIFLVMLAGGLWWFGMANGQLGLRVIMIQYGLASICLTAAYYLLKFALDT